MVNNLARARARKAAESWLSSAHPDCPMQEAPDLTGAFDAGAAWAMAGVADLISDAAALLRGYEAHHRRLARSQLVGADVRKDRHAKADRNAAMAARLESWLAGDQIDPDAATGCADDLTVIDRDALESVLSFIGGTAPLTLPPAPAHSRAPDDLTAAIAGAGLIEEGAGWVKVHGVRDSRALFDVLAEANARASGAAAWRTQGNADLAAFRITTGDPRFDPGAPVTINGFRYQPTKED